MSNQKALDLIRENLERQEPFLDLGNLGLTEWPKELFQLDHLEKLNLGLDYYQDGLRESAQNFDLPNQLSSIPRQISKLGNLKELFLSHNKIFNVENLKPLSSLTLLDLSSNQMREVDGLSQLSQLSHLNLSYNQLRKVDGIQKLDKLRFLHLTNNRIENVEPIVELPLLENLNLAKNQIQTIDFPQLLPRLFFLDLSFNYLDDLSSLAFLEGLQILSLNSNNKIGDITPLQDLARLVELHLSDNAVKDLSPLASLVGLQSLNLNKNQIEHIDPLKECSKLEVLDLSFNALTDIEVLKNLKALVTLNLRQNKIQHIRPLSALKQLRTLDLGFNQVDDITPLRTLKSLIQLKLGGNQIRTVEAIKNMKDLVILDLSNNQLKEIEAVRGMHGLRSLLLGNNQISDAFPVEALTELYELDLQNNSVSRYPFFLLQTEIEYLNLADNPVEDFPSQYLENRVDDARNWFAASQNGMEQDREIRVLLLGPEGAGKTTLQEKLWPDADDSGPKESIRICQQNLNAFLEEDHRGKNNRVWTWKLGGDPLVHPFHRFFIHPRALCLLVWVAEKSRDSSRRNPGLDDWLFYLLDPKWKNPLILIQNKIDRDGEQILPYQASLQPMKRIKGIRQVSALTGARLEDLRQLIRHSGTEILKNNAYWPTSWLKVRNRLMDLSLEKTHLDEESFLEICTQEGLQGRASQTLKDYLRDEGWILFDRQLLGDKIIIDHRWGFGAFQKLLDRDRIFFRLMNGNGRFRPESMELPWKDYEPGERIVLFNLLEKLEVCFPLKTGEYFIPNLLPPDKPSSVKNHWSGIKEHRLKFIFESTFFPYFLFTKLTSEMLKAEGVEENALWQTGLWVSKGKANALVEWQPEYLEIRTEGEEGCSFMVEIRRMLKKNYLPVFPLSEKLAVDDTDYVSWNELIRYKKGNLEKVLGENNQVIEVSRFDPFFEALREKEEQEAAWIPFGSPGNGKSLKVFISYSHRDEAFKNRLREELLVLERVKEIEIWDDRALLPGSEFDKEILDRLLLADVICLLISKDFIKSDYCWTKEMEQALQRHKEGSARVVPVVLKRVPNFNRTPFSKLTAVPSDAKPVEEWEEVHQAWQDIGTGITRLVDELKKQTNK